MARYYVPSDSYEPMSYSSSRSSSSNTFNIVTEAPSGTVVNKGSVVVDPETLKRIEHHANQPCYRTPTLDRYTTRNTGCRNITNNQSVIPGEISYGKKIRAPENSGLGYVFETNCSSAYITENYGRDHVTNNHARYGKVEIRGNPRTSHVFVTRNDGSGHATYNDQEVVHSKSIVQYVVEFFRGPFVEDHSSMEIEGASSSSYSFRTTNRGDGNVTKNG